MIARGRSLCFQNSGTPRRNLFVPPRPQLARMARIHDRLRIEDALRGQVEKKECGFGIAFLDER
jgi:hypothetical protein